MKGLVNYMKDRSTSNCPMRKPDVGDFIKDICDDGRPQANRLKETGPTHRFFDRLKKRNPELKEKTPQRTNTARAKATNTRACIAFQKLFGNPTNK